MKLLIIENDERMGKYGGYFQEFIAALEKEYGVTETFYCFNAINEPKQVCKKLKEGFDMISLSPNVLVQKQWEFFIDFFEAEKIKGDVFVHDALKDFEFMLRVGLDMKYRHKIIKIGTKVYVADVSLLGVFKKREIEASKMGLF